MNSRATARPAASVSFPRFSSFVPASLPTSFSCREAISSRIASPRSPRGREAEGLHDRLGTAEGLSELLAALLRVRDGPANGPDDGRQQPVGRAKDRFATRRIERVELAHGLARAAHAIAELAVRLLGEIEERNLRATRHYALEVAPRVDGDPDAILEQEADDVELRLAQVRRS